MQIGAFGAQREALRHAETVLFVDDREAERAERNLLLEERVSPQGDLRLPRSDRGASSFALFLALTARQPGDLHSERRQPFAELAKMLLGENLRWRHHRGLHAVLDGAQSG